VSKLHRHNSYLITRGFLAGFTQVDWHIGEQGFFKYLPVVLQQFMYANIEGT
jgi:hypothetical protein